MKPLLTDRELEILRLLADGNTGKQAGRVVGNTPHTIKSRMSVIRLKLGASNTAQAVSAAHQMGLL